MLFKQWLYSSQSWFKSRGPDWPQRPFSPRSPWQAVAVLPWEGRGWSTRLRTPLSTPVCKKMFKVPSPTQTWHMQEDFRKQQKNMKRPGVRTFWQAESTPRNRSQGKPAATPTLTPGRLTPHHCVCSFLESCGQEWALPFPGWGPSSCGQSRQRMRRKEHPS